MAAAGLIVEGLFTVAGLVPTDRPETIVSEHFSWNYTTFLNIIFLGVFGVLYWLRRNRARFGGGVGYAFDPVCGMQVRTANAPATATVDHRRFYFCSDHCRERFEGDPARHATATPSADDAASDITVTDPICGMTVDTEHAAAHRKLVGHDYWFCSDGCAATFDARERDEQHRH
jgi:YHS domain-containing protein